MYQWMNKCFRRGCCPPEPPFPPGPSVTLPDFCAQYAVAASPASGSNLPFIRQFSYRDRITLADSTTIRLPEGYLYLISYVFIATPEAGNFFEVVPQMNGVRALYGFYAPAGQMRNASASASFTTDEALASPLDLSIRLTYPAGVRNIDISGAVSITPLALQIAQGTEDGRGNR